MRILPLLLGLSLLLAAVPPAQAIEICGYSYPSSTRFVVADGGTDWSGNVVSLCSEYGRLGGARTLGLPISRPFRIGPELYQAFEYGVIWWNQDKDRGELLDTLDVLHAAGRDPLLERLGVPPGQEPNLDFLTDPALSAIRARDPQGRYGVPTSPPMAFGPYVAQRFQRAVVRRWLDPAPYDIAGALGRAPTGEQTERVMVGDLMRASGLIPAAALVADPGTDGDQYNWLAVPTEPASFWQDAPRAVGGWDGLFHRVGAFNVGVARLDARDEMRAEVEQASTLGLTLAVNSYVGRDSTAVQAGLDRNLLQIDTFPWDRIAAACGSSLTTHDCHLGADQLAQIEEQVKHHLLLTRLDDSVAGYWVLDDYAGDVRPAIELVHRLVQDENLLDRQARPTVCGFGGDLDDSERPPAKTRAAFDLALRNFTSTGCDAVALYPYRRPAAGRNAQVDWSMHDLLPYMQRRLREKGWDPATQPLVGIPQTFAFGRAPAPTPADIATQTGAYCAAGASSIVFYAWNDSYSGPKAQLFNAPDLRQGVADSLGVCQSQWAS